MEGARRSCRSFFLAGPAALELSRALGRFPGNGEATNVKRGLLREARHLDAEESRRRGPGVAAIRVEGLELHGSVVGGEDETETVPELDLSSDGGVIVVVVVGVEAAAQLLGDRGGGRGRSRPSAGLGHSEERAQLE